MKLLFLSFVSALFLVLSFPPFDLELFAWVGFVPIFFALEKQNLRGAFWLSLITGCLFFFGLVHWIRYVTWVGCLVLVFYLSFYFALFGLCALLFKRLLFLLPCVWVSLEFLRSHLFGGFGWGLLGYSQWHFLPLIQCADLVGAYGVSFLVILGNVVTYQLLQQKRKRFAISFMGLAVLLGAALLYGNVRLVPSAPLTFRASVIQGNIPQHLKWDLSVQDLIMQKYERLTREVAQHHPDIIFWPETAVPGFLPEDEGLFKRLITLSRDSKTYLLVGSPWVEKGLEYNSALFLKEGEVFQRYDKLHLVPFGEFIPFEKYFPKLREWITTGSFHSGKEATVFKHPKGNFSVLVCFEDIFPDLVRLFAKDSDFLVNITNDAWFMKSGAPFQHAQASCFRAIENRRTVLRIANTGYTCLIDPWGRILYQVALGGEKLFVTGWRTWEVPLSRQSTFYTRHGDLFAWVCLIMTLAGIAFSFSLSLSHTLRKKESSPT